MDIRVAGSVFRKVTVPVLWGHRAIVQDDEGRISVIDLGGSEAVLEILGDEPAPGARFELTADGFALLSSAGEELYSYNPEEHLLTGRALQLPDVEISKNTMRVGGVSLSGNTIVGFGVGVVAGSDGSISLGAPLPPGLARLTV